MITAILNQNIAPPPEPKEGDLYRSVTIAEKTFDLRYGYYEDFEREHHDPIPIYPDFRKEPIYTADGIPLVTAMQDACSHYEGRVDGDSCFECKYFRRSEELFGFCQCQRNAKKA